MSNLKLKFIPATFAEADEYLGDRDSTDLAYATRLERSYCGDRAHVTHHGSTVATYYRDAGTVRDCTPVPIVALRTAGWDSATTTRRLHMVIGAVTDRLKADVVISDSQHHGIGIKHGQAELRYWDAFLNLRASWVIGRASVIVRTDGTVKLAVDTEV